MNKIVFCNFKMNFIDNKFIDYLSKINNDDNLILALPYTSLHLQNYYKDYKLAAQNFSISKNKSTGEIDIDMIKQFNINYCIVGHYERRRYFNETFSTINKKVRVGIKNNLNLVVTLCSMSKILLKYEINNIFEKIKSDDFKNIIIAYEPSNMIGSNNKINYKVVNDTIHFIRKYFKRRFNVDIKILYGGNVNELNIKEIYKFMDVDGVLVGKASLEPNKINKIIKMS